MSQLSWGLIDMTTCFFFLPYFTLSTFFSGFGKILKRENNVLNELMTLILKRKKMSMVHLWKNDSKMALKRKCLSLVFFFFFFLLNICVKFIKFECSNLVFFK